MARAAGLLGYCVTIGSMTLNVPQIVKCVRAGSVDGLSFASHYCELQCYMGSAVYHYLYGYPFR